MALSFALLLVGSSGLAQDLEQTKKPELSGVAVIEQRMQTGKKPREPKVSEHYGWFKHKAQSRKYLLQLPPDYETENKKFPLVLMLHGGGADISFARMFALGPKAAKEGFIVAYPNGSGRVGNRFLTWNAIECCGFAKAHQIDDVAYLKAFVDKLVADLKVDPERVYCMGFSNGAQMVYRLATECPEKFAAVAVVSGSMCGKEKMPEKSLPIMIFHATADRHIPVAGGGGKLKKWGFDVHARPLKESVAFWVNVNGCTPEPSVQQKDGLTCTRYQHGKDDSEVVLYTLEGFGHSWPGGKRAWLLAEAPCRTVSVNDLAWNFFSRHRKIEHDQGQTANVDNAKRDRRGDS